MAQTTELSTGASKLLERVIRKPVDLYWGRSGWRPSSLPAGVKAADFDELVKSRLVRIDLARLVAVNG